jgi:hypothetical protein
LQYERLTNSPPAFDGTGVLRRYASDEQDWLLARQLANRVNHTSLAPN